MRGRGAAAGQPGRAALVRRLEGSLDVQLGSDGDAFGLECARFHAEISRGCGLVMLQSIAGALEASARNLGPAVTRRCEGRGLGTRLTAEHIVADHTRVVQRHGRRKWPCRFGCGGARAHAAKVAVQRSGTDARAPYRVTECPGR